MIATDFSHYKLLRRLGVGGMGEVHLAVDQRLGRQVALKFLKPEFLTDLTARQRFEFEARAAAILHHPNITTLFDFDAERGCISLEFVEGTTLEERLLAGPITPSEVIRVAIQVCRALDHAHGRNVVHRDLKPSNILLGVDGSIKLTDFGLAKVRDANFHTATGVILGTTAYMCPEQIKGEGMDARGDLFALGVILHRAITGNSPWKGQGVAVLYSILHDDPEPLRFIDPALPAPLERVVLRLLAREPADRFASAVEVEGYLSEIDEELTGARPSSRAGARSGEAGVGHPGPGTAGGTTADSAAASLEAEVTGEGYRPVAPRPGLIGRDAELARLVAALDDTRISHGRTMVLAAEAGGGKSRLMDEFRLRAEAGGRLCLFGRCTPQAGRNFQPFVEALEEFARRTAGSRARSAELTASHPELATVLPTLELLLDPGHDPALEPKSKEQLWHLVDTLLKRMARQEPLILFLDDLHWADEGTLALLHHVTLNHAGAHLLLVGAYRPEDLVGSGGAEAPLVDLLRTLSSSDRFETMTLAPLGATAMARLVRSALPDEKLSDAWLEGLHQRSMGNPFFALEMARLERAEASGLPGTIADVLNRRLARLSGEEREILEMAAVEGEVFHTDVLEAGTGLSRVLLLKRLRVLSQGHHLIAPTEEGHRFSHGLIREVLLGDIPLELKREYHAAVALSLTNGYADRSDYAGRIGHHLFEGGRFAESVSYLTRAGFEARRLFLSERALEFLDQALGALDRAGLNGNRREEIARARCETLLDAGRPEAARAAALVERERAVADGNEEARTLATIWLGEAALSQGDHGAANAWLSEGLALAAARSNWAWAARAERKLGELLVLRGDYEAAFERLEAARQACQRLGDESGVAQARLDAGMVLVRQGRYDRARECFVAAHEQLTATGERPGQVRALNLLGSVEFTRGETGAALEIFMKARALAREIGHLQESARLQANIANVHLVRGELDVADRSYREALSRFEEIGDGRGVTQSMMALGNVATLRGDFEEAAGHYRQVLAARREAGDRWGVANVLDNLGVVEYYLGRWSEALGHAREALSERVALGDRPGQAESSLNVGHLLGILGDLDGAARLYAEAEAMARKLGDDRRLARALLSRATHCLWRGEPESARKLVTELTELALDDPILQAARWLFQGLSAGPDSDEQPEAILRQAALAAEAAGGLPEWAQARLGLAQVLLAAGRRDEAIRELEAVLPRIAEGRLPLLELRSLVLRESAGALLPADKARRTELVQQLTAQLPTDFPGLPDFNRPPFPIS